jgi:hypothetical protein
MARYSVAFAAVALGVATSAYGADTASGTFNAPKIGTIAVSHAAAYTVPDQRDARSSETEILLADVPLNRAELQTAFDPHMVAINLDALRGHNYVLLWVRADGSVSMNATFSKTMTQYLNDTNGGLSVTWTTKTSSRLEGRLFSTAPMKTFDGETYTVDLKFGVDLPPAPTGQRLAADGGEPGRALTAFLAAVQRKNWTAIKAGSSPRALGLFDHDYNSAAENASGVADLINAWIGRTKLKVTGGVVAGDVAVLDVESELFPGQLGLSRVEMVRTPGGWKFNQAARSGLVR